MKRMTTTAAFSLAWGIMTLGVMSGLKANDDILTVGSAAPTIDIEHWVSQGNGRFEKVTKFEEGKVYIIEFWATWCGPCIASMPHLVDLQERYAESGVQLISVSDEDLETVESFLKRPVQGEQSEGEKATEEKELTYGKLTSAYCLTADPDRSVHSDYMEAAGQNGIPTAFIVGKDGAVEWIGHPMRMDQPLKKVLAGEWDREAARAEILPTQLRGVLTARINSAMRDDDSEKALSIVDKALEDYSDDKELVTFLRRVRVQVQLFPAMQLARQGKHKEALEALEELKKSAPEQKSSIIEFQLSLLLNANMLDEAAIVLDEIVGKDADATKLNQISWMIYESSEQNEDYSQKLLQSALAAAKKAAELEPEEGAILDTLAHLLHRTGDLEQALKVQTRAVELVGDSNPDVKAYLEKLKQEKDEASDSSP